VVLVDGGLVNPVPVSLARAMGADVVIAVDLGAGILGRHLHQDPPPEMLADTLGEWIRKLQGSLGIPAFAHPADEPALPTLYEVVASSINIMQVRISRSRMAGDPPDVTVEPRLAHFHLLDFHRAKEAIEEGRRAVERVAHTLALLCPGNVVSVAHHS
jgi:NTE family protein